MKSYFKGADVLGSKVVDTKHFGKDVFGDVFGDGLFDMIPGLGMVGKLVGGGGATPAAASPTATQDAVKKALEEEHAKQAAAKQQKTTNILLYSVLGVVGLAGVGLTVWAIKK